MAVRRCLRCVPCEPPNHLRSTAACACACASSHAHDRTVYYAIRWYTGDCYNGDQVIDQVNPDHPSGLFAPGRHLPRGLHNPYAVLRIAMYTMHYTLTDGGTLYQEATGSFAGSSYIHPCSSCRPGPINEALACVCRGARVRGTPFCATMFSDDVHAKGRRRGNYVTYDKLLHQSSEPAHQPSVDRWPSRPHQP